MGRSAGKRVVGEGAGQNERPSKKKALEPKGEPLEDAEEEEMGDELGGPVSLLSGVKRAKRANIKDEDADASFVGDPIPPSEAIQKWPTRYTQDKKNESGNEEEVTRAKRHYKEAMVDGIHYNLGDDAYVKAEDGKPNYIARIIEMFESTDGEPMFTAQWFYRAEDTVIKDHVKPTESRRVFLSEVKDDNPLNCLVANIKIAHVEPNLDIEEKERNLPPCDLYYDMKYTIPFLSFEKIPKDDRDRDGVALDEFQRDTGSSNIASDNDSNNSISDVNTAGTESAKAGSKVQPSEKKSEMYLLDLYAGCGAMSTGLNIGASLSGVKLVTKWAVDINKYACQSLEMNHPETQVRNEPAEDFLSLLKEWEKLCRQYSLFGSENELGQISNSTNNEEEEEEDEDEEVNDQGEEIFEVEKLLDICFGDPNNIKERGLYFKVHWKGYGPDEDTWEPIDGLSEAKEKLKDFVTNGYQSKILPLPGDVDFICGGPPCQGISGFNRFRNKDAPLNDPKNHQMVVYMDIVEYLKPKFLLMENVVDLLRFAEGFLARYALGRLISMNYQARLGMMAAGSYGLPQFRMRVFMWGAQPSECLPQYPLPTHEVIVKGFVPAEFEEITVAYDKLDKCQLPKALVLEDAISDLPPVENNESRDEMNYGPAPQSEFQKFIRLKKGDIFGLASAENKSLPQMLYDHRPLKLNDDDYQRVLRVPKKKGANFRDFPGVLVKNNKVEWDPTVERVLLPSGKPLVPDYAMSFVRGTSPKPFGRIWWDETVPTVVTRAEPHNQIIIHPAQDRVLTIRENARLQGFPDCYQLFGPIKERYIQVGNAVAVPVGTALGYTFGMATQGQSDGMPVTTVPFKYPHCLEIKSSSSGSIDEVLD